jgi:hypothetical protein
MNHWKPESLLLLCYSAIGQIPLIAIPILQLLTATRSKVRVGVIAKSLV